MDDAQALPAVLRALLITGGTRPLSSTAIELARAADIGGLDELAALVTDRRLSERQRASVLGAIAIVLAMHPAAVPPHGAFDAIEDAQVVTTAISCDLDCALTGVLAAAPRDADFTSLRRLIAHQLLAHQLRGPHVVQLLRDAGEHERAASVAAADLGDHLKRLTKPTHETWVRIRLLLTWAGDLEWCTEMLSKLGESRRSSIGELEELVAALETDRQASVSRVRSLLLWVLDSSNS